MTDNKTADALKEDEKSKINPFEVEAEIMSSVWIKGCPPVFTLPVVTIIAVVLGLLFGWMMYELDVPEKWMDCYNGTAGSSKTEYFLNYDAASDTYTLDSTTTKSPPAAQSCWLEIIDLPGYLWIRALKCVVSPLIASMMLLVPSKVNSLGKVGTRVAMLLFMTSSIAAIFGLIWGNVFSPGKFMNMDDVDEAGSLGRKNNYVSEMEAFLNIGIKFVPLNIFDDLANLRVLGIITFFLSFGYYMEKDVPAKWKAPVLNAGKAFLRASLNVLMVIMWTMPIAMFSILAASMMETELKNIIGATSMYLVTQLFAQAFHLVAFYFTFFFFMTRRNPIYFFANIIKAPFTALLSSSSAATLPITLQENIKERGDNEYAKKVCEFVIPLGATLNMDGTSLGFPIMVLFVNQVGEELGGKYAQDSMSFGNMLLVALLSMVCSLGTAPIPSAGLVYLTMLLEAADIVNTDLQALGMAMIVIVDWIVDRVETAQNVTSDSFISAIIAYSPCFAGLAEEVANRETEMAANVNSA